jgi:von Willebrand factor type A domain
MRNSEAPLLILVCVTAIACSTAPVVQPVDVQPVTPGSGEMVSVDQSITIVDTSASISDSDQFPGEKALARSLVSSMPAGNYEAGTIVFGGVKRDNYDLGALDRAKLASHSAELKDLREGTPLDQALAEAGEAIHGKSDHAAITVISDGKATDVIGREVPEQQVLDAAAAVVSGYDGNVCIHTIQIGGELAELGRRDPELPAPGLLLIRPRGGGRRWRR